MPDIFTHYVFGDKVLGSLPDAITEKILRPVFDVCTAGPDIWFSWGFYLGKRGKEFSNRGTVCQKSKTGEFLSALAGEAKEGDARDAMFSYLCGYLCHYALDSTAHPFIIWFTGEYDGTERTRRNRGNHTLLERALEHRTMQKMGVTLSDKWITRKILRLFKFPKEMREGLERVYRSVYGWEKTYLALNRGVKDMRRFYALVQGSGKLMTSVARLLDNGVGPRDYTALPYADKEQPGLDVENLSHALWKHPKDERISSRESFPELMQRAEHCAAEMIQAAYAYIYESGELPDASFENRSYETGFDCLDPRNAETSRAEPLSFRK